MLIVTVLQLIINGRVTGGGWVRVVEGEGGGEGVEGEGDIHYFLKIGFGFFPMQVAP